MHELSIAQSIIDVATEQAMRQGDVRVMAIYLKLGPLSGVAKDALISAWELARECSEMPDSRLVIEEIAVTIHCPKCNAPREAESMQSLRCKRCGTASARVLTGREMEITSMEIVDKTPEVESR